MAFCRVCQAEFFFRIEDPLEKIWNARLTFACLSIYGLGGMQAAQALTTFFAHKICQ